MNKPVLKYLGGKRNIMNKILPFFPKDFNNYHEPFCGGLSVFLELINKNMLINKKIFLSDYLKSLINLYIQLRDNSDEIINILNNGEFCNDVDTFNKLRIEFNMYNCITNEQLTLDQNIRYACLMLYLNKTSYGGVYRENSKGGYNVPFGKYKNPTICDSELLKSLSNVLNNYNICIRNCDFRDTISSVKENDLVYLDPPYHNTFTSYTNKSFNDQDQNDVKNMVDQLTKMKVKVIISNSDNDFIRKLYSDYNIHTIDVRRNVNQRASENSKKTFEVLITNF